METLQTKSFPRGSVIIKEGEISNEAYIVSKGMVKIVKQRRDGQTLTLAEMGPGQLFGEMCLFGSVERTASIIAITDVELNVIDKEHFQEVFRNTPLEAKLIIVLLARRLQKTSELASDLSLDAQIAKFDDVFSDVDLKNIIFPS